MSRPTYSFLESVPSSIEGPWLAAARLTDEPPRLFVPHPGQRCWIGNTARYFVYLAEDERGRQRIRTERALLVWARQNAIPVPPVVGFAEDGSWLVTERVPDDGARGRTYVDAALDVADRISRAPAPGGSVRRGRPPSPPLVRLVRIGRLARGPVRLNEFMRTRREAGAIPADTLSHGDFHTDNVLYDSVRQLVVVTDLEGVGLAPQGTDPLTLWCGLELVEDREALVEALVRGADRDQRIRLATLHRWLALRSLADLLVLPRSNREPDRIAQAVRLVQEARTNAQRWTA